MTNTLLVRSNSVGQLRKIRDCVEYYCPSANMWDETSVVLRSIYPNLSYVSFLLASVPGYVSKWKRHWFVLNDAVLYYFITPQHQDEAPRCIIPLEGINISPIGATDLSIGLRVRDQLACFLLGISMDRRALVYSAVYDAVGHCRGVTIPDLMVKLHTRLDTCSVCPVTRTLIKPFFAYVHANIFRQTKAT